MLATGDIVVVEFPGVNQTKNRPAIVVSTEIYHQSRPDVILGILTSQTDSATSPTDYLLQDWKESSLYSESAYRSFFVTVPALKTRKIGRVSDRDWLEIQKRISLSMGA